MENPDNDELYKKMQDDIKGLQTNFSAMSGDVKTLNDGHLKVQGNVETICANLDNMNKSISEMMEKLNAMAEEQQKSAIENMLYKKGNMVSGLVKKPLRKLAVGTIGTMMCLGGYAAEKLSGAREGLEDIIAEASYNNKMRRQNREAEAQ